MSKDNISIKHLLTGASISCLEWYEYSVYAYFAPIIGQLFFPDTMSELTKTMYSFAVFAIGFLFRPVGSIIFGTIGDTKGRKYALICSLIMMGVPALALALLPTYSEIGIFAPITLVLIRIFQGIAIAGNYGGSFVFLVENSPKKHRCFASSCSALGTISGLLCGSGMAAIISTLSSEQFLMSWGWRIPYILSGLTIILAYYCGTHVKEIHDTSELSINKRFDPIKSLFKKYKITLIQTICLVILDAVGIYTLFVFAPNYMELYCHIQRHTALSINTFGMLLLVIFIPFFGKVADKIGAKKVMCFTALSFILLSYPIFILFNSANFIYIIIAQIFSSIIMATCYASVPITVVSLFSKRSRYTGTSIALNICLALFGGSTPFILTSAIEFFNYQMFPAFYMMIAGIISMISIISLPKNKKI